MALVDALGNLAIFMLLPGQRHDNVDEMPNMPSRPVDASRRYPFLSESPPMASRMSSTPAIGDFTRPHLEILFAIVDQVLCDRRSSEGALQRSPADLAVAMTGVAGPEPDRMAIPLDAPVSPSRGETSHLERNYGDNVFDPLSAEF